MENCPYIKNIISGDSYDLPEGKPGIVFSIQGNLSWIIPGFTEVAYSSYTGMIFYCETAKVTAVEDGKFMFFPVSVPFSPRSSFLKK